MVATVALLLQLACQTAAPCLCCLIRHNPIAVVAAVGRTQTTRPGQETGIVVGTGPPADEAAAVDPAAAKLLSAAAAAAAAVVANTAALPAAAKEALPGQLAAGKPAETHPAVVCSAVHRAGLEQTAGCTPASAAAAVLVPARMLQHVVPACHSAQAVMRWRLCESL